MAGPPSAADIIARHHRQRGETHTAGLWLDTVAPGCSQPGPGAYAPSLPPLPQELLGGVFGTQFFDVAKYKNGAKSRFQALNGFVQDSADLLAGVLLLRIFVPNGDFPDYGVFASVERLVERNRPVGLPLAELHQGFVDGDADNPGVKLRLPLEIP